MTGQGRKPGSFFVVDRAAWEHVRRLDGAAGRVYVELANRANDKGVCWPSASTVCEDIGLSRATFFSSVEKLVKAGLIVRTSGTRKTSNEYRIVTGIELVQLLNHPSSETEPKVVQKLNWGSSKVDTPTRSIERDSSNETQGTRLNGRSRSKNRVDVLAKPDELLAYLIERWNAVVPSRTVKTDPVPKYAIDGWKRSQADSDLKAIFGTRDAIDALVSAIPENGWALESNWFDFESLFEKDSKSSKWKAQKLLNRQYADGGKKHAANNAGAVFDSAAAAKDPNHGKF